MAKRGPKLKKAGKLPKDKDAAAYEHTEEKFLLRPDVGLEPQFKPKKPPKTYRYDPTFLLDVLALARGDGVVYERVDRMQKPLWGPRFVSETCRLLILKADSGAAIEKVFLESSCSEREFKKIAVEVIDDRGNELTVVKSLEEAESEP